MLEACTRPLSDPTDDGSLTQGKQSILLSSVLLRSSMINAINAVTCKMKFRKTAKAAKKKEIYRLIYSHIYSL